jgi:hypothetical protein
MPGPTASGVATSAVASGTPIAPGASSAGTPGSWTLGELLAQLRVAPEDRAGYVRSLFPHWIDADGDGCDTRREVLITESLDPITVSGACSLSGGRWRSPYDDLETTDASSFDIDHIVPLAEAWDSGASAWTTERRTRYANDLGVDWALVAVSASSNRSKGDRDPAAWLPPDARFRCTYLGMWLSVKVRWQLTIDDAEQAAIREDTAGCDARRSVPIAP